MQKLVWQNANGDTLDLTSGNYGITEWEGFSNASLNIQSQQVPFQDGAVFLDALIEPRELSVTLAMQDNNDLELRYQLRRELIHKLNPKLGEGYLIYTNDFISKRIKCVAQIPLFETHNSNDSGTPKASLSWVANEPYWEDLEETVVNFNIGNVVNIVNNGEIPIQTEIMFVSKNVENPSVINMTNNKQIEYDGILNKNLYINTNYGKKEVVTKDLSVINKIFLISFNDINYDDGKVLFFGIKNSLIVYSYGLENWQEVYCKDVSFVLNRINYYKELNIFLVTGNEGNILTSSDLTNWEARRIVGGNRHLFGNCYSESLNLLVVVGGLSYSSTTQSVILTSSDGGNTWTTQNYGNDCLYDICYNSDLNIFVIVGENGTILTSSDGGNTWTNRNSGVTANLFRITYILELQLFIVTGFATILTSPDGITWTSRNSDIIYYNISRIIYNKDLQILVGVGGNYIITSSDAINWSSIATPISNGIVYSTTLQKYIRVGDNGYIGSSSDLIQWKTESIPDYNYSRESAIKDIIDIGDEFIAVGDNGYVLNSFDGDNWEIKRYLTDYTSIAYSNKNNIFVATSTDGIIVISNDLINWTNVTSGVSVILRSIIYVEELDIFIVVGNNGTILTSTDGTTWTSQTSGTSKILNRVFYNKEKQLILIGGYDIILKSSDGITWTTTVGVNSITVKDFAYNKYLDLYIAVGNNGYSLKSTDGTNWSLINALVDLRETQLNCSTFNDELMLFITSTSSKIYISYDTEVWDVVNLPTQYPAMNRIVSRNDYIILVGNRFTINKSILEIENQIQNISDNSDIGFDLEIGKNKIRLSRFSGDFSCRIKYRQKYIGV